MLLKPVKMGFDTYYVQGSWKNFVSLDRTSIVGKYSFGIPMASALEGGKIE